MVKRVSKISPVDAIAPIGSGQHITEVYPFVASLRAKRWQEHGQSQRTHAQFCKALEKTEQTLSEMGNDPEKLEQDKAHYLELQAHLLIQARRYFYNKEFKKSENLYVRFINQHDTFGQGFDEGLQEYFPALFEYSWLLYAQKKSGFADQFITAEVADYLRRLLLKNASSIGSEKTIRRYIKTMQAKLKLPTSQNFKQKFPNKALYQLAKYLIKHEANEEAKMTLGFLKVRQLLRFFKTELLLEQLPSRDAEMGGLSLSHLPVYYDLEGLSYL